MGHFRLGVIMLLLVAFAAMLAAPSAASLPWVSDDKNWEAVGHLDLGALNNEQGKCNGKVGDCIDQDEEMMMDNEASRRVLRRARFIGYGALRRNNVPCRHRGASYYNCRPGRANPYARGCSRITACRR